MDRHNHLAIVDSRPIVRDHGLDMRDRLKPLFQWISAYSSVSEFIVESFHERGKVDMVVLGVETIALVDEAMDQLRQVMDDNVPIVLYDSFFRIVMLTYLFQKRVSGYLTFYNDFEDFFEIAKAVLDGNRAFSMLPGEVKILDDWGGPRQVGLGTTHLFQLSGRELELFRLLLTGADPYDCSNMMGITVKSVENLKERLMRKLNVHSTSQLLLLGVKFGFGPR